MNLNQYISVCGLTDRRQVIALRLWYEQACAELYESDPTAPTLVFGVMACPETMNNQPSPHVPNHYPKWSNVGELLTAAATLPVYIHFDTREPFELHHHLVAIEQQFGGLIDGFQLNLAWPSHSVLEDFKRIHPNDGFIIPIGLKPLELCREDPQPIRRKLNEYAGLIHHVLLDCSRGKGQPLDPELLRPFVEMMIWNQASGIKVAVAGGLTADSVVAIKPLLKIDPSLSICAQSGLRTNDQFDVIKAKRFITTAMQLMAAHRLR